jgi:hypothetical protein
VVRRIAATAELEVDQRAEAIVCEDGLGPEVGVDEPASTGPLCGGDGGEELTRRSGHRARRRPANGQGPRAQAISNSG